MLMMLFYRDRLSCSELFLDSSIPAAVAQISNSTTELIIPTGILANETKAAIKTHPVTVEAKISRFSI